MTDKDKIEQTVKDFIKGTDLFLVSVKVSSSNKITVLADGMKGITIDECASIHRYIEKTLDRNVEDFELQVSSPGLNTPFGVIEQYYKNEGKKVEVADNNGNRFIGQLKNVTAGGFEIVTETNNGRQSKIQEISFNYDQIKSTKEIFTIK